MIVLRLLKGIGRRCRFCNANARPTAHSPLSYRSRRRALEEEEYWEEEEEDARCDDTAQSVLMILRLSRPVILGISQPAKNRNLSRLISNLSRLKKQSYPVLVYPVIFPV
jgi:hypothetical protein